jgi:hypothetical protein
MHSVGHLRRTWGYFHQLIGCDRSQLQACGELCCIFTTFYVSIDSIATGFYYCFNKISLELLWNFYCPNSRYSFFRFNVNNCSCYKYLSCDLIMSMNIYKITLSYSLFMHGESKTSEIVLIFEKQITVLVVYRLIQLALLDNSWNGFLMTKDYKCRVTQHNVSSRFGDLVMCYMERGILKSRDQ